MLLLDRQNVKAIVAIGTESTDVSKLVLDDKTAKASTSIARPHRVE